MEKEVCVLDAIISTLFFDGSRQVLWNYNLIPFFRMFSLTRKGSEKGKEKDQYKSFAVHY